MGGFEAGGDLAGVIDGGIDGQRTGGRGALDQFHDNGALLDAEDLGILIPNLKILLALRALRSDECDRSGTHRTKKKEIKRKSLRAHVAVSGDGVYDPDHGLERVVGQIGAALPNPDVGSWWYIAAAPAQAFVFLQDVAKPNLVPIGSATAFVRMASEPTMNELDWALTPESDFIAASTAEDGDDDLIWNHEKTAAQLIVLVSQALPAWQIADMFLRQEQIGYRLRSFPFWAVEKASSIATSKVRNLCPPDWFIIQSSNGDLFWAHPPDKDAEAVEIAKVLDRMGIVCLRVKEEDREWIIDQATASPSEGGMITSSRRNLLTPILSRLRSR